jgi:hypothetical protein
MTDFMPFEQFGDELRRSVRFDAHRHVGDPLAAAVVEINANPAHSQSRLLARVLCALAGYKSEFRRAEISGFDLPTRRLVVALLDAERAGAILRSGWLAAVAAAHATGS